MRTRFHRGQDSLYLALRESYTQLLDIPAEFLSEHLGEIVALGNERVLTQRTVASRAESLDWQIAKRLLEQAAAEVWQRHCRSAASSRVWIERLTDTRFLAFGFEHLVATSWRRTRLQASVCPQWRLTDDVAEVVLLREPGFWAFVEGELETLLA